MKTAGMEPAVLLALAACLCCARASADRGGWKLDAASVSESGQKAIIGWDGLTQTMILATDVSAAKEGVLIEFMPLPAMPEVAKGDRAAFEQLNHLLARHGVGFPLRGRGGLRGKDAPGVEAGFSIRLHRKIGAHDITVVEVRSATEFAEWIGRRAAELAPGAGEPPELVVRLVEKYIKVYKCPFFVFDVVTVGPDRKSVEPIVYTFKSDRLFYPLEISRTFAGKTSIDLFVLSQERVYAWDLERLGFRASTVARVEGEEIAKVSRGFRDLLGASAHLQAFKYEGELADLRGNVRAGSRREHTREYTKRELARYVFRSGTFATSLGFFLGAVLAMAVLLPMYTFAARDNPPWGPRAAAGVLVGIPSGFFAGVLSACFYEELARPHHWSGAAPMMMIVVISTFIGFVLFFCQLGLRRRWWLWGPVYVVSAIPASGVVALATNAWFTAAALSLAASFTGLSIFARLGTAIWPRVGRGVLRSIGFSAGASSGLVRGWLSLPEAARRAVVAVFVGAPVGVGMGLLSGLAYWALSMGEAEVYEVIAATVPMAMFLVGGRFGLDRKWVYWFCAYLATAVPASGIVLLLNSRARFWPALQVVFAAYAMLFLLAKLVRETASLPTGEKTSV